MKTMITLAALLLGSSAAIAGPFGLPDHEQDGYRDTGCDPALQVDKGGYSNNPSCPGAPDGGKAFVLPEIEDESADEEDIASK